MANKATSAAVNKGGLWLLNKLFSFLSEQKQN